MPLKRVIVLKLTKGPMWSITSAILFIPTNYCWPTKTSGSNGALWGEGRGRSLFFSRNIFRLKTRCFGHLVANETLAMTLINWAVKVNFSIYFFAEANNLLPALIAVNAPNSALIPPSYYDCQKWLLGFKRKIHSKR